MTNPFANTTPEIDEENPVPVNREPAIPAPPDTTNAPVEVELDIVVLVTANPDNETMFVLGFTTKETIVDKPKPEPLLELTAVTKNDWFNVVGITATEEAAAGGTACQVG